MTEICSSSSAIDLGAPRKRWALWHVTANCNLECAYCYGSFEGVSYKQDFNASWDVPLDVLSRAAHELAALGFTHVHVNGGEPFLRKDIWEFYRALVRAGLHVWTLTNGTVMSPTFAEKFADAGLDCLAVSVDTLDISVGDKLREKTGRVITALTTLADIRAKRSVDTSLGIYVVLTPNNLDTVYSLVEHVASLGFDYVNMQPMYLPDGHPLSHVWLRRVDAKATAMSVLATLRSWRDRIDTSSNALIETGQLGLSNSSAMHAVNCFADLGDYLYIGPRGDVQGCPSKPAAARRVLGNIVDEPLAQIHARIAERAAGCVCPHLSLDCLGMYEMAYQFDYKEAL